MKYQLGVQSRGHGHYSYAVMEGEDTTYVECKLDRDKAIRICEALNTVDPELLPRAAKMLKEYGDDIDKHTANDDPKALAVTAESLLAVLECMTQREARIKKLLLNRTYSLVCGKHTVEGRIGDKCHCGATTTLADKKLKEELIPWIL